MMKRLTLISLVLAMAACGNSENNATNAGTNGNNVMMPVLDEQDHACMHMESGPDIPITAADAGEANPLLGDPFTRYDVTMPAPTATVQFDITEATMAHLFFDQAGVDIVIQNGMTGDEIPVASEIASVAKCDEVDSGAVYDMAVGTYLITITGPSEFSMVFVPQVSEGEHMHME